MIEFIRTKEGVIFRYTTLDDGSWVLEKFRENKKISINRTFHFGEKEYITHNSDSFEFDFQFAVKKGAYDKIKGSILGVKHDLYISRDIELDKKKFVLLENISVFSKVFKLVENDIYIGGDKDEITLEIWNDIIKKMPNRYEMSKYTIARIDDILSNYVNYKQEGRISYEKYMNKKETKKKIQIEKFMKEEFIKENEIEKYEYIIKKLKNMLNNESVYSENNWQDEIIKIILLLYPKYISVFKEVSFEDIYNNKKRRLDFMLVDVSGFIDIVEIKKSYDIPIMSKNRYRDNYIPTRQLTGTIMQIEKYIFYLNKRGIKVEKELNKKHGKLLPNGLTLKVTNPKGIIIMGRSNVLCADKKADFEIVKRKYNNIVDIMTYDDLIFRLENIIKTIKNNI